MTVSFKRRLRSATTAASFWAGGFRAPTINIVGVFRSGTNLLKTTLETHYTVRPVFSHWHWKHGLPPTLPKAGWYAAPPVPMVVISKAPEEVNVSLHRFWDRTRPELGQGVSFSDFIRRDFIVYDNSFKPFGPQYRYTTPTDYWNKFHYAYVHWPALEGRIHFLRYEDFVGDTDRTLRQLADTLGLRRRSTGEIRLPDRAILPSSDKRKAQLGAAVIKTNSQISDEDRAFIHSQTLNEVAARLGYAASR